MHDKKRPVEGEHLSTGRWFLSFKPHGIASQHLLTGNLSGVLRGKRRSGIDGLLGDGYAGSVLPMLTPCAPPGAKRHWNVQSQNSFFTVIGSGGRSSSAG